MLEEAGDYEVEVYLTAPWAVYADTRYAVRHDATEATVFVNQAMETAAGGSSWVSLGVYAFASGSDQWVSVYDNVATTIAAQQHVNVDALRLTRVGVAPPVDPPIDEAPPVTPGEPDPDVDPGEAMPPPTTPPSRAGRCAASPLAARTDVALALGLAAITTLVRRRRAAHAQQPQR